MQLYDFPLICKLCEKAISFKMTPYRHLSSHDQIGYRRCTPADTVHATLWAGLRALHGGRKSVSKGYVLLDAIHTAPLKRQHPGDGRALGGGQRWSPGEGTARGDTRCTSAVVAGHTGRTG